MAQPLEHKHRSKPGLEFGRFRREYRGIDGGHNPVLNKDYVYTWMKVMADATVKTHSTCLRVMEKVYLNVSMPMFSTFCNALLIQLSRAI